jgi:hypothetical protein
LTELPITSLTQVVADGLHGHVFLSADEAVVVTNLAGKVVTTLDVGDKAAGMALSPDGGTLYVALSALHITLRLTASAASVTSGTTVQVTVRLGKTYNSRVVSLYAQPASGAKKLIKSGKVNSQGILTVSYKVTKNTTFTAVFAGDAHYAPATAKATVKA